MNLFSFVKSKLSILEVVNSHTTLKKAGQYWKGRCPFHHERTASFTVSPDKEIFYCFGCHAAGDVISFISKIEHCSQLQAAQQLAEQYALELPEYSTHGVHRTNQSEKKNYYAICKLVALWAHEQLKKSGEAREYLLSRAIGQESILEFQLGYLPAGQAALKSLLTCASRENILAQDLVKSHILFENKQGLFCPFEERILFPIKDHMGNFCGFGGRIFKETDTRAKYYNSHDHAAFNKSSLLFGLDRAKKYIQQKEAVFLVEGYTDLIAMVHHGYPNSVATLGTACTAEHLKLLARYAHKVSIAYDGDPAGQAAILRLARLCWQSALDLYVIPLPSKHDPASYLSIYKSLDQLILNAEDIFSFFIKQQGTDFKQKSTQDRLLATKQLLEIVGQISDPLKQDILLQQASTAYSIPFETLKRELQPVASHASQSDTDAPEEKSHIVNSVSMLEKKLFSAILYNKIELSEEDRLLLLELLPTPLNLFFKKVIGAQTTGIEMAGKTVFDIFSEEEKQVLSRVLIEAEEEETRLSEAQLLEQFHKKQWKIVVHNVKLKIDQAQKKGDSNRVKELLSYLDGLKKKMLCRGIQ